MNKTGFLSIIFLAAFIGLQAQSDTSINKNVVVVKEYNPTIDDANKINLMPEIIKEESTPPVFNYSFFVKPLQTSFEIIPLNAATLAREPQRDYDQNYARLGFGSYPSVNAELFYNAFRSDKHQLTFLGNTNYIFGKVKLQDDTKSDATSLRNNLLLSYKRQFWGNYLKANLGFSSYNYRYYGYQTLNPDSLRYIAYNDTTGTQLNTSDILAQNKPGYASFEADFTFASNPRIYDEIAYRATLYYDHFFTRMDLTQDVIGLKGYFENPVGDNLAGGNLDVQVGLFGTPDDTTRYVGFNNYTYVNFSPYFKLNRSSWSLKLGLNSYFLFGGDDTQYLVTPDVKFNFNLIEKLFKAHVMASGDYRLNDYRSVLQHNPYIDPEQNFTPTELPLMLEAGLTGQLTPKLVFNGAVNFSIVENNPFFVNALYKDSLNQMATTTYSNRFVAEFDDMNVLTVKAAIDYAGNDIYSFGLSGAYYSYTTDNLEYAWHLPEYEFNVYGHFVPYRNVNVDVNFKTISEREVQIGSNNSDHEALNAVYDLSFAGSYIYNNRLTAYLNLNNVLGSRYYYWNGYPSFGFNAMVGLRYKF